MVDDKFIPDEDVTLGQAETETDEFNDRLRELAVAKFAAQYGLDVDAEDLVVAERKGFVSVYVAASAGDDVQDQ